MTKAKVRRDAAAADGASHEPERKRQKLPLRKAQAEAGTVDVWVSGASSVTGVAKRVLNLLEAAPTAGVALHGTGKAIETACRAFAEVKLSALVPFDHTVSTGTAVLPSATPSDAEGRHGSTLTVHLRRRGDAVDGI